MWINCHLYRVFGIVYMWSATTMSHRTEACEAWIRGLNGLRKDGCSSGLQLAATACQCLAMRASCAKPCRNDDGIVLTSAQPRLLPRNQCSHL